MSNERLSQLARWGRSVATTVAMLFGLSTALPVIAGVTPEQLLPGWVGYFDVGLAATLFIAAAWIEVELEGRLIAT
jgi:hypothetical protein